MKTQVRSATIPLVLSAFLLSSGCTVQIWGKKEVVTIESTPASPAGDDTVKASALPPAAIPLVEAFFKGFFGFLNKSREAIEKTHIRAIEFDRPMKRETEFNLFKVQE